MKESAKLSKTGTTVLLCGVGAILLTVLLSMLCSVLILREVLPADRAGVCSAVICAVSVLLACLIAASRSEQQTLAACLCVAVVYFAILLLAKAFVFPGSAQGIPARGGIILASALPACLLKIRRKGRGAHRRKAYK